MLEKQSCIPCKVDVKPLNKEKIETLLNETSKWKVIDDHSKITRNYAFDNFVEAQSFANKVADLCESEFHHADITFGWGYCSIIYYSHKIGGLHENDFIMAAKCNEAYNA